MADTLSTFPNFWLENIAGGFTASLEGNTESENSVFDNLFHNVSLCATAIVHNFGCLIAATVLISWAAILVRIVPRTAWKYISVLS